MKNAEQTLPANAPINADGVWAQVLGPVRPNRPALFLDRDGVVVHEVRYLDRAEDVRLIPGAAKVITTANDLGLPVILVSNQSGIARGYFGWADFKAVQDRILDELAAEGARIDGVFACPHHPEGNPPYINPDHPARKPNPGMLVAAEELMELDLHRSWIIGDRAIDMEAGARAGLAGGLHVLTGHGSDAGEKEAALALNCGDFSALAGETIADALQFLPLLA